MLFYWSTDQEPNKKDKTDSRERLSNMNKFRVQNRFFYILSRINAPEAEAFWPVYNQFWKSVNLRTEGYRELRAIADY